MNDFSIDEATQDRLWERFAVGGGLTLEEARATTLRAAERKAELLGARSPAARQFLQRAREQLGLASDREGDDGGHYYPATSVVIANEWWTEGVVAAIFKATEFVQARYYTQLNAFRRAQADQRAWAARNWLVEHEQLIQEAIAASNPETTRKIIAAIIGDATTPIPGILRGARAVPLPSESDESDPPPA